MMKKKAFSSTFVWLKDVGLKVFAILALVIGGFYAYAAISWPPNTPNAVTGVVGMFVGESSVVYSALINGYERANSLCANGTGNLANSHVCTAAEMSNSYNHSNVGDAIYDPAYTILWINSSAPGNIIPAVSDCKGWQNTANSPYYGNVWNFTLKVPGLQPCGAVKKFACCK